MRLGRAPRTSADGSLPLWPPLLATRGPGSSSGLHAHHAMHLVLAEASELRVRSRDGKERRAAGVVTLPDVPHAIDARGVNVVLVFLEPESDVGASLLAVLNNAVRYIDDREREALLEGADPGALMGSAGAERTRRAVSLLGGAAVAEKRVVHPRVKKLLGQLRALPPDGDTSLEALAEGVGLSPGRLMHAFTESIGVPLRPYLQWLKLQRAAGAIVSGETLSAAAHAAGFADAAHMSRTFKKTLGPAPSALRG
jgi:AraC-like DNA-binding protein